jgi:uncharacterized damage-inducible protein DinB
MLDAFRIFARYNKVANERLYEQVGKLDIAEYRRERRGSFGSIHALLNHILVGDRIWMSRFSGGGKTTPPLNTILFETFAEINTARAKEDAGIVAFFEEVEDDFLIRQLAYSNSFGKDCVVEAGPAALHFFNHQTHHRGQVHVMLSQTEVSPPALDMHRILNS